jgi:DNA-binding transcriptional MerR regulator
VRSDPPVVAATTPAASPALVQAHIASAAELAPQAPAPVPAPAAASAVARKSVGADVHESFTVTELCASTGVSAEQLAELESYGLLAPRRGAGIARYSHGDAQIVRSAAGFLSRGVEARHLRAWRQAVDREAALFDQLVLPLMRQRNPIARQQAAATLDELSALGADLRAALLQGALKHHFDS